MMAKPRLTHVFYVSPNLTFFSFSFLIEPNFSYSFSLVVVVNFRFPVDVEISSGRSQFGPPIELAPNRKEVHQEEAFCDVAD